MRRDSRLTGVLCMAEGPNRSPPKPSPPPCRPIPSWYAGPWPGFVQSMRGHGGRTIARDLHGITLRQINDDLGSSNLFAIDNRTEAHGCPVEQAVNAALDDGFREAERVRMQAFADLIGRYRAAAEARPLLAAEHYGPAGEAAASG